MGWYAHVLMGWCDAGTVHAAVADTLTVARCACLLNLEGPILVHAAPRLPLP